jgi:hypothetical protein
VIGLVVWDWGDWWVRGFLWFNCGWINFLTCKLGGVNILVMVNEGSVMGTNF